jgi:hypothetical protein
MRYIIYQADFDDSHGWEARKLAHTQSYTFILHENWGEPDLPLPKPGDRPLDFLQVPSMYDPAKHGWSTHYRPSDWQVARVTRFVPEGEPDKDYEEVVICVCRYAPIDAPLMPMPDRAPLPELPDEPSVESIASQGAR